MGTGENRSFNSPNQQWFCKIVGIFGVPLSTSPDFSYNSQATYHIFNEYGNTQFISMVFVPCYFSEFNEKNRSTYFSTCNLSFIYLIFKFPIVIEIYIPFTTQLLLFFKFNDWQLYFKMIFINDTGFRSGGMTCLIRPPMNYYHIRKTFHHITYHWFILDCCLFLCGYIILCFWCAHYEVPPHNLLKHAIDALSSYLYVTYLAAATE